jgi:glycosyltransferase involved in cell wall biosynthesis
MITGRADFGGGPEHVFQLTRAIGPSATVHIACPREEPYWSRYASLVGADRMFEIPHRRFALRTLAGLVRYIRAREIDIVHGHGRAAGIFARPAALLAGARCFYTPHGGMPVDGIRTFLKAAVEYLLSTVTHGIIAVSGTEGRTLEALCAFRSRIAVIRNGVEIPPTFDSPGTRLAGPVRVVHVTRFVYQKNSLLLLDVIASLRAMGKLDPFEFLILGDGPGRGEFEAAASSRGLGHCVKLLGAVANPGACLAGAFCFLSTSRWEGLPLALLEAMARGVPAIATDVPGNSDAVTDHETGFLYDMAAPHLAAQRLVQLAHHPVLWKQMVRAARQKAEREFSVQAMADATLRLYTRSTYPGSRVRAGGVQPPAPCPASPAVLHSSSEAIWLFPSSGKCTPSA